MSVVPCRYQSSMTYFWLGTDVSDLLSLTSALTESQASLQEQTRALEERAIALRVFLEQGRQERGELAESLRSNLDSLIVPWLDRLSRALAGHPEAAYVEAIRETLRDVAGGLYDERGVNAHPLPAMTVREQEVLQLVRQGQTTDQIAAALHLSSSAVSFHRKNIRRKLGLHGKAQRLNSYVARR
jgi:DNA-binding CsgD family transcriptional regulator